MVCPGTRVEVGKTTCEEEVQEHCREGPTKMNNWEQGKKADDVDKPFDIP